MIQQIKIYLRKYNNPDLWLEQMRVREEKKQQAEVNEPFVSKQIQQEIAVSQTRTVFRKSENLYNLEEANQIRQIYDELEGFISFPHISFA